MMTIGTTLLIPKKAVLLDYRNWTAICSIYYSLLPSWDTVHQDAEHAGDINPDYKTSVPTFPFMPPFLSITNDFVQKGNGDFTTHRFDRGMGPRKLRKTSPGRRYGAVTLGSGSRPRVVDWGMFLFGCRTVTLTDDKSRKAAMVHHERAKGLQKLNSWSFILSEKGLLLRLLQNSITLPYLVTFVLGTGDSFPRPNFTDDIQNFRYLPEYRFLTFIKV